MEYLNIKLKDRPHEHLSDLDLLNAISDKSSNPIHSVEAFNEFYFRYKNYVWKVCFTVCGHHRECEELAKDILQNTFIKVHTRAGTYKANRGIKAWLGTIIKNEVKDQYRRKVPIVHITENIDNLDCTKDADEEIIEPSYNKIQLSEALSQMEPRERDIILTYFRHYDSRNPDRHLPDLEIKFLTEKYGVTPAYLRTIKKRVLRRLQGILKK
jgi:RNA polymerase sigma factor (sigma-70 family)